MPPILHHRKHVALAGAGATLLASVGVGLAASAPAQAVPIHQQACVSGAVQTNTAANGWRAVNGSAVTVNAGGSSRLVVLNFNADAGVDSLAEIRLGYRVDAGPVQTPGAQNFANHTQYWQTRHSMVVLRVPPGTHRIQPYWRISGSVGKNGVLASRCLTAEAYTS